MTGQDHEEVRERSNNYSQKQNDNCISDDDVIGPVDLTLHLKS